MVKICEHTQAIPSICFWIMFAGVAVKLPMFPCHNWLPNVHVKSPTICSVLFASIVLKFSTLLFVKLLHPLFSAEINTYSNLLIGVCLLGAIFACANLFFQNDLKKIFAYFSILHMNLYLIILLSGSNTSIFIFSALYHSFIMATLFFITDLIETLFKTRNVTELQGVALPSLKVKGFMLAAVLMLIGAPPSWGFIAEVMTMHYAYHTSIYVAEMVCLCMLVSSSRVLFIYQKIFSKWSTNTEICTNHRSLQNAIIYVTFVIILAVGTFPCLLKFS
jgi:NADH-quinone oxidoreductase subunit M